MNFLEYFTDVGFVIVTVIGTIFALFAIGLHRRENRKRNRG